MRKRIEALFDRSKKFRLDGTSPSRSRRVCALKHLGPLASSNSATVGSVPSTGPGSATFSRSTLLFATLALITHRRLFASISILSDNVVISRPRKQLVITTKPALYHTSPHTNLNILNFCRATANRCTRTLSSQASPSTLTPLRARGAPILMAAERGWLQVDDPEESNLHVHANNEQDRFDWRLRAPSRSRKPPDRSHRGFIKRNHPPNVDVQIDEPFYEAITAYKDRYGLFVLVPTFRRRN